MKPTADSMAPPLSGGPTDSHPQAGACFGAIRAPELYRNFLVHGFVMFPAGMVLCYIATLIDGFVGFEPLPSALVRLAVGGLMVAAGGLWVWYVYGFLYLVGHGSPGTHVDGGPTDLVDTGPYTMIRHPSVVGKVLAVAGLGVASKPVEQFVVTQGRLHPHIVDHSGLESFGQPDEGVDVLG